MKVRIMRCHAKNPSWDKVDPEKIKRNIDFSPRATKGQLISEWICGVFKSPKKPTKFLSDFCPMKLGHKSVKKLVDFLGDLKAQKFHSEIKWPLNVIQVNSQNTMQIIGKQSQHQTKGKSENLFKMNSP